MKSLVFYFALIGFVLSPLTTAHASPPPLDRRHGSAAPFEHDHPHPYPVAKQLAAADLNVGEPRTVRIIYFRPNDRPYDLRAVTRMQEDMRKAQAFFAEQMQAHGYDNKTFRVETDAQGEPLVHRVDGQHPESHYFLNEILQDWHFDEFENSIFDLNENIYVVYIGLSVESPNITGYRRSKKAGDVHYPFADYNSLDYKILAHELGHAFGLGHDFRSAGRYIMSYGSLDGPNRDQLSMSSAKFLSVHPYFNLAIPLEEAAPPHISILSPTQYPSGSKSIPIQLEISDSDELHQVILESGVDMVECRDLDGQQDIVRFEYDGFFALRGFLSLPDVNVHPLTFTVVDTEGNLTEREFRHGEASPHLITTLLEEEALRSYYLRKVLFSPDGTTLVSTGREISLWDVATLKKIAILKGHDFWINSVSFSPDGTTLVSTGIFDDIVHLWDVATPTKTATLHHSTVVNSVLFSPDGTILATGGDGEITLWDVATETKTAILKGHSDRVDLLSFSPDGRILASASLKSTIILWDVATRARIKTFPNKHLLTALSFSPDGTILASGELGGQVYLWDVKGQKQQVGGCNHQGIIASVLFSPTQGVFASAGLGGKIILWDTDTQEIVTVLPQLSQVQSVSFSPTQGLMASGSDNQIFLWDVSKWIGTSPPTLTKTSGQGDPVIAQATPPELTAHTVYKVTEASLKRGVSVPLALGSDYEYVPSIEDIPEAVTVSGIPGVTIGGWGSSGNPREIFIDIYLSGDIDSDAVLTFTVAADAIANYNGPSLSAQIPVTASRENATPPELTAHTVYKVTEASLKRGVSVTLALGSAYEYVPSIEDIPEAVTVSGIPGVTIGGWGSSGNPREIFIDIYLSGDIDSDAVLTFTVAADAIANYNGSPPTAQIPVTASQENALIANFPNPFNPETYISYQLAEPSEVTLTIYTLSGQVVRRLVQAHQAAGAYEAYWDGRSAFGQPVASGVYFYRLTAGDFTATRKMLIQK